MVEDGEYALFHFAGVLGTGDDHHFLGKVDHDGGLRARPFLGRVGVQGGREKQREFRDVVLGFQGICPDE